MNHNASSSNQGRVVSIETSDVITSAGFRIIVKSVGVSTDVSMSEELGRWKPKGGLADPLRDARPKLRVSETLFGNAEIIGSRILAIGQDPNHSQQLNFTMNSQPDFDGESWEHSRGWLKFVENDFDEKCWSCWFNTPHSVFQSLAAAVRRKSVCRMSLFVAMRTHGHEFANSESKVDKDGVEIFVTTVGWDEESGLK